MYRQFWRDYNGIIGRGVEFISPPAEEDDGAVVVFEDLYGNFWDLIEKNHNFFSGLGTLI